MGRELQVLTGCREQHGKNWLTDPICRCLLELHRETKTRSPDNFDFKVCSVEVFHDKKLVAGEIGGKAQIRCDKKMLAQFQQAFSLVSYYY